MKRVCDNAKNLLRVLLLWIIFLIINEVEHGNSMVFETNLYFSNSNLLVSYS